MKLRTHLIILVVAALLPVLIFAGVMLVTFSAQQRNAVERGLVDTARALSLALDREIEATIRVLQALATSEHLETGDLKQFYDQARRTLKTQQGWDTIALFDSGERQLLNLLRPFGSPMPPPPPVLALGIKDAIELKRPIISNLFVGRVSGELRIAVTVPLIRNGKVKYVVATATPPAFLVQLLKEQNIPADWLATIIDRNQIIIARTRNLEEFLGKPSTPLFAAKSKEAEEGSFRGVAHKGEEVYAGFHLSDLSGWTVGLAIPVSAVESPLRRSLLLAAAGGLVLLLLGIALAALFGHRVTASVGALCGSAAALGGGETPQRRHSRIAELNEVEDVIETAAATRKRAEAALRESEARYRSLFENMLDGYAYCRMLFEHNQPQDFVYLEVNSAFEKLTGLKNVVGRKVTEVIPGLRESHPELFEIYGRVALTGQPERFELYLKPLEAWLAISVYSVEKGCFVAVFDNITERKRAEEETQKNLKRIHALHEIDTAISSTLDLRSVLNIFLEKVGPLFPYPSATTVRLLDKKSGDLNSLACSNIDEEEWKTGEKKRLLGRTRVVIETGAPLAVRNLLNDPHSRNPDFYRNNGLVSYLGVPLISKGEVLGVLGFYSKEDHEFSKEEVEFLNTLAGQAAVAINNAQLYENIDLSRKELELTNQYLETSLRQLSGLYTALTPLTPSGSIHEMMDGIIEKIMEATGADAALIRLYDEKMDSYPIAVHRGFPDYYLKSVEASQPGRAAEWVYKHREPIIAPDIALEPRLKEKIQIQLGLPSCAILPLMVHDEARGIIHLASRKLGYFDEEQSDHLMAIARQMGIALENREHFDKLKASRDELEKSNRVKDEFLSVMSHELRTPLNVVVGYSGMIMDGMLGEVNEKQKEAMEKIIRRTYDQLAMVNNILYATVLETEKIKIESHELSLEDFITQLKSAYAAPINKELVFNWEYPAEPLLIKTDSTKLKQILQNLIDNALKFTDKGSITVSAQIRQQSEGNRQQLSALTPSASSLSPRWVEFAVADTGAGIPKEALPIIFDKFRQVDSSETRSFGGVGMGLYIVKKFTELLGGQVEVESEAGKGSTFTVRIPH